MAARLSSPINHNRSTYNDLKAMKKKIYVKPCVEVIVIDDLCDTNAPYMGVGSPVVDAAESS